MRPSTVKQQAYNIRTMQRQRKLNKSNKNPSHANALIAMKRDILPVNVKEETK